MLGVSRSFDAHLGDYEHIHSQAIRKRVSGALSRKRLLTALFACSLCIIVYYLATDHAKMADMIHIESEGKARSLTRLNALKHTNATTTFRENLLPSQKYITAFTASGFTNQVMASINLVYLATLTNRTPIIPPLLPSHVSVTDHVPTMNFGNVFDVPRLANRLNFPVIEWHEVKSLKRSDEEAEKFVTESIGCWNTAVAVAINAGGYQLIVPAGLGLDVSYTPVPSTFTISRGAVASDYIWSIWSLASLSFPETRRRVLDSQRSHIIPALSGSGHKIEPDDQLLCYDMLYYVGLGNPAPAADFFADYSPFWNNVGTHLHWKPSLVDLANQYLRRHFGVSDNSLLPPFISVHVRRTDFVGGCGNEKNITKCFAPVRAYERRVNELKQRLEDRPNGIKVSKVLVTSDERNRQWWDQIAALGAEWTWIDHAIEETAKKHGPWFPMILDVVFQSMGAGFVGTDQSTMSLMARNRVRDWQGGLDATVFWGNPNADDH